MRIHVFFMVCLWLNMVTPVPSVILDYRSGSTLIWNSDCPIWLHWLFCSFKNYSTAVCTYGIKMRGKTIPKNISGKLCSHPELIIMNKNFVFQFCKE